MNINKLIDNERWLGQKTLHGEHDYREHNESLDRIAKAIEKRINELEKAVKARDEMLICYRTGKKRPSAKTLEAMSQTRAVLLSEA